MSAGLNLLQYLLGCLSNEGNAFASAVKLASLPVGGVPEGILKCTSQVRPGVTVCMCCEQLSEG